MEQVYTSKIDTWLAVVLLAAVIACLVAFGFSFRTGSVAQVVATFPAILIGAALPIWLLLSTSYTLSERTLLVKSGPFKWRVPIKQITSITPTSSPLSSPALSLDRLRIDYGRCESIMISPKNKEQFIQDLNVRRGSHR
ncbi:MAG: PH domain-containing protein [Pseudohongiella sp.]|nr:PH domain-containing protein [Pseudohongiella sp.]